MRIERKNMGRHLAAAGLLALLAAGCLEMVLSVVSVRLLPVGQPLLRHGLHIALCLLGFEACVLAWHGFPAVRNAWSALDARVLDPVTRSSWVDRVWAVCAGLMFLHHFVVLLFYPVLAAGAQKLTPVWMGLAAAGVLLGKLWKRKEIWILSVFWLWMLERLFLEVKALSPEAVLILSAALYAFLIAYPAFLILRPRFRKPFLTVLAGCWALVTAVLAVWGVILCWTSGRVLNVSGEFFGLTDYGRLALFSNPNITGGFFACGVLMTLVVFGLTRKKGIRILCGVAVIPMIMATSLSGTRCAALAISAAVGLLICLLLQRPLKGKRFRYGILAVVFVLCFGALTLAQIRFNGYFIQFRNSRASLIQTASAEEAESEPSETEDSESEESEEPEAGEKKPAYIQQRGGLNFSSLDDLTSGRIGIWADGFHLFRGSFRRMLLGDSILNPGLASLRMNHYHNIFLQVLYESGIPGFLLFLAFLVFFLIRAVKLFRQEGRPLWQRFLPVPALAILVMDLVDCLTLFANGHPPLTLLYLFMGAAVAVSETASSPLPENDAARRKSLSDRYDPAALSLFLQQAAVVVFSLLIAGMAGVVNRAQPLPVLLAAVILCFGLPCVLGGRYVSGKPLFPVSGRKFLWAGLAVICLLYLLLALNNSSVGVWRLILMERDYGTLLGVARPIRGDEWAVWTPELFSQAAQGWPAVNTAITAGAVDPALVAIGGLPAWNLAVVFKPFYWGFLLLGAEAGFSLMTLLRFGCLAFVSFLAAKRYTRNHLPLSVAAAFLITLSPYVQWWFSQSICEVLIFSQGAVLCWIRAMEVKTAGRRLAWGALAAWCLGCFVLVLYPAWLIPVAWGMLAVLLWLALRYRKQLRGPAVLQVLAPLIPVALLLFFVFRHSWDTLMRIQASVYPGQRVYTGGDRPLSLFTGLYSLTFPAVASTAANTSDLANFLSFAPAGLVLAVIRWIRTKKTDGFSVVLLVLTAVFGLFALIPLPAGLAKGTLLSLCSRPGMILSLCNLLLLLRSLALGTGEKTGWKSAVWLALLCTLLSVGLSFAMLHPPVLLAAGLLVLGFGVFWLLFSGRAPRLTVVTLCLLSVAAGAFVNPVQKGLASVKELPPVQAVESADLSANTVLAVEANWPAPDALLFSGKRVLNSTFPYADPEKWRLVDPEGRWKQVWNRLCHVSLTVAEDNSRGEKFALVDFDHISVSLTPAELQTLGVQILVTQKDHPEMTLLSESGSWKTYRLGE